MTDAMGQDGRQYRTVDEVAAVLQVSKRTVVVWIAAGERRAVNVARARGGQRTLRVSKELIGNLIPLARCRAAVGRLRGWGGKMEFRNRKSCAG